MRRLARTTGCLIVLVLAVDVGVVGRAQVDVPSTAPARRDPILADARAFLEQFVDRDGRVVRRDQGGDTVSEGQAYAMLLAVAADDRGTFDRVWGWARLHLERDDGLLAWRWADGQVADGQPATDADLDAAWALALADRRWPGDDYGGQAADLARAVERLETADLSDGRPVLVPGPWARERADAGGGVVLNPSYSSPVGEAVLVDAGHLDEERSAARGATMRSVLVTLLDRGDLPSNWIVAEPGGALHRVASPEDDAEGRYGWDAVRIPLRLASSCDRDDRSVAARLAPALRDGAGSSEMGDHPARVVAVAAALAAAGEGDDAGELLDRASRAQAEAPTYYGGALTALARALLTSHRLGGCPPM